MSVRPRGMAKVGEDENHIYFTDKAGNKQIKISTYNISIFCDKFDGKHDMVGIIIYQYDGKTQYILNNMLYQAPFIYLCKTESLSNITSKPLNTLHARCYKKVFGVDPDYTKIVGAGFAFKKSDDDTEGVWRYRSGTFCAPQHDPHRLAKIAKYYKIEQFKDDWHGLQFKDDMSEIEIKYLKSTIDFWIQSDFKKLTYIAKGSTVKQTNSPDVLKEIEEIVDDEVQDIINTSNNPFRDINNIVFGDANDAIHKCPGGQNTSNPSSQVPVASAGGKENGQSQQPRRKNDEKDEEDGNSGDDEKKDDENNPARGTFHPRYYLTEN